MNRANKIIIGIGGAIAATAITSLGMFIYNSKVRVPYGVPTQDTTTKMVSEYNNKFSMYFGDKCDPTTTKTLISLIQAHNNWPEEVDTYGSIELVGVTQISKVKLVSYYKIEPTKYSSDGTISQITITEL